MPAEELWTPVVFARTRQADIWWQVRPPQADQGWLDTIVKRATVAGGAGLAQSPRFLFAQRRGVRLVGVACQAKQLSQTMNSDGSRDLYCFVGWLTTVPLAGPDWETFQRSWLTCAKATYDDYMGRVWDEPSWSLAKVNPGVAGPAPWGASSRSEPGTALPRRGIVGPESWGAVWNGAMAVSGPMTVVLGWTSVRADSRVSNVDYLGVTSGEPTSALKSPAPGPAPETPETPSRWAQMVSRTDGIRWIVVLVASAVCLLLGLGAGFAIGDSQHSAPTPISAASPTPHPEPRAPTALQLTLQTENDLLVDGSSGPILSLDADGNLVSGSDTTGTALRSTDKPKPTLQNCQDQLRTTDSPLKPRTPETDLVVCVAGADHSKLLIATVTRVRFKKGTATSVDLSVLISSGT